MGRRQVAVAIWTTLATATAAATVIAACVGDDANTPSATPGDLGEACLPENTCHDGLTCIDGLCIVHADPSSQDGSPATVDGGDANADSAVDSGPTCDAAPIQSSGTACPINAALGTGECAGSSSVCCIGADGVTGICNTGPCPPGAKGEWDCTTSTGCGVGHSCCLVVTLAAAPAQCPPLAAGPKPTGAVCRATSCNGDERTLCRTSAECPDASACAPFSVSYGAGHFVLGACQ
jgi:hypothetical protein